MKTISARELERYASDKRFVIIDLRPRSDFARGHVRGAVNVPQGRFGDELTGKEKSTVILYCERGALSMAVARELEKKGFRTMSVVGGYRAYRNAEEW